MSVSSATSRIVYTGNNSLVTAYAVPFYFEENAHLNAIAKTAAGVETVVTLTNHTGAGDPNGGTVRTAVAVPATSTLTIYREVPFTQTTSYAENDAFPAESHERALDKLTTITQQLERRITNCIRGTEATPLSPLPSPTGTQQFVLTASANQPPSWQEQPSLAVGPIVATGSTQARFLSDRFADTLNVKDFGAAGDGVADDTPAIQAAVNACGALGLLYFPSGTYRLNSNVTQAGKALSYLINPGASFTGVGVLENPASGYGFYYDGKSKDTKLSLIKSDDKTAATAAFVKYSTTGNSTVFQNPALFGLGYKFSTAEFARVQGVFGEAIDAVGGAGSFVEGGRFHGICALSASSSNGVYGIICKAQSGTATVSTSSAYVIGAESEVISYNAFGNAPPPRTFNTNRFSACYLATLRDGGKIDAAFLVNPFNNVSAQAGFVVAKGVGAQKTVESVAFGCYETGLVYGLDLADGSYTYAAMSLPNNSPIRAFNAAKTAENNVFVFNASDILSIGVDLNVVHTQSKSFLPSANNTWTLGAPSVGWQNIYANNSVTVISDARLKTDIADATLGLDFINALRPVSYRFIEGGQTALEYEDGNVTKTKSKPGVRTHWGLIAQEVKTAVDAFGVDFSGWALADKENSSSRQFLRYDAFIAPIIKAIQQLDAKIGSFKVS